MLDKKADEADVQSLLALTERLLKIAPVFFSMGNHEQVYLKTDETLLDRIAQTGAVVVNDSYADVTLAGQPLRIGGTMGYGFAFGRTEEEFTSSQEYVFLKAFENTEFPKICLAHMPDTFIFNGAYTLWDVDLVAQRPYSRRSCPPAVHRRAVRAHAGAVSEIRPRLFPAWHAYADGHYLRPCRAWAASACQ